MAGLFMIGTGITIRARKFAPPFALLMLSLAGCSAAHLRYNANEALKLGHNDAAIADFTELIALEPDNAAAYAGRASAYARKGDYDRAIADAGEAIRLDPQDAKARDYRGIAYDGKGDYDRAIADYSEAISLNRSYANAYGDRALVYYSKGDYEQAIADFDEVLRLDPKNEDAYASRGRAYFAKGDNDRAIADLNKAIGLDSDDAGAYYSLGNAYYASGDQTSALSDYQTAANLYDRKIAANPGDQSAFAGAAWLLATCPVAAFRDRMTAYQYAKSACKLTVPENRQCLDTLAAAYAEYGDFDGAVGAEESALSMVNGKNLQYRKRLQLYQSRQPYRADMK